MYGPRLREALKCSAPGARQPLLVVVYGDKVHIWKVLVENDGPDAAIRGPLVLAGVLVAVSTDCN